MILSHRHRFIFIKTLKTAGTSIEVALARHCGPDDIVTPINPPVGGHQPRNAEGYYNHIGAADIRARAGTEIWDSYFKFAFERNPWDKVVSYYHWVQTRGHRFDSFEAFIAECVKTNRFPLRLPSSRELYTLQGRLAVDRVGRYESLREDLRDIGRHLGLALEDELPRAKGGLRPERSPYQSYYTPATRAVVALFFAPEIRQFGYRFGEEGAPAGEKEALNFTEVAPSFAALIPRGNPCPCGSGQRFKACHGTARGPGRSAVQLTA